MTPREIRHFATERIGRTVRVHDLLPSTNDAAARLADNPENDGTIVLAEQQSAGRGQYGRVWQSRPGTALLFSILLFPPPDLRRPVILTAWAAVSVARAIQTLTGSQVRIKWPNDLYIHGRKVCGILIEQGHGTIVGIGLNVNQSAGDFEAWGLSEATSLGIATGTVLESENVFGTLIRHMDEQYSRLVEGDRATLESEWKWRLGLLGRQVTAESSEGEAVTGSVRDFGFDGLELELGESAVRVIRPEAIRQLRTA